ncbi:MAG: LysR family transcriptional regulator [Caldimonas sp.]
MSRLNYHHLHYFWAVAKEGNLTRAATRLHISQSALSNQIRQLEEQFGHALFARVGRTLQLTEAGRIALAYADPIFTSGSELLALLRGGERPAREVIRIGAVANLSRNFVDNWLKPLLGREGVGLVLQSGGLQELLARLRIHTVDVVLSNRRVPSGTEEPWRCRRIARQAVSLVGQPRPRRKSFRFPEEIAEVPLLLPSRDNDIRAGFDLMCEQLGLRCNIRAEVDDMAMLRLLARDSDGVALLPGVVVQDEIRSRRLAEYCVVPDLHENFYAITVQRRFEPRLLKELLGRREADVLGG